MAGEPFWKYIEYFKGLLTQYPYYAIEKWQLCQIVYDGLTCTSKIFHESVRQEEFMNKNTKKAWEFLEELY